MCLWSIKLCTLLVALFCKLRDLKYSVSPLQVHKSCSINFKTRTCRVVHCANPHSFPSVRTWEETNVNVMQNDKHCAFVTQCANNFFFFWVIEKSPSIVRQRIFSTINPPGLYVILTVYRTFFHLHSHCLTIEQVCFLLREEYNAGWERFVSGTTK